MKRILITMLVLATIVVAQNSYTDDSLLDIDYLKLSSTPTITAPDNFSYLHEGSNIYEHNGELIWMSTMENSAKVNSLHYWVCPNPDTDLEVWEYRGEIVIKDGNGRKLQAEDPYFYFADGMWWIYFENKTEEEEHGLFKISVASYAYSLSDTFWFLGGKYGLAQFGDSFAQDAIYSACPLRNGNVLVFDGRKGRWTEEIGIAFWDGNKYVPNPEPIFTVDDIDQPASSTGIVLTTGIGDNMFDINGTYIMEIVAYKDWDYDKWLAGIVPNGYWCQGLAVSTSLTEGWEVLNSDIKDQDGNHTMFNMFYSNGWKALGAISGIPDTIFLAEVISNGTQPPPPSPPPPVNENLEIANQIIELAKKIK